MSTQHVKVTVNGEVREADVEPRLLLVHLLRDNFLLTGTHIGCDTSNCGACTVHVDGAPVRSCAVPVSDVAGREVVTLEGLGTPDNLHPLQQAFLDEQAAQCGYCIPGIIMTAADLLSRNSRPTEAEIRAALNDTLCRCGAHVRIVRAIQRAAVMSS